MLRCALHDGRYYGIRMQSNKAGYFAARTPSVVITTRFIVPSGL